MEPKVNVGILRNREIRFSLIGSYLCNDGKAMNLLADSENTVSFGDGQILWNSNYHKELIFSAQDENSSFVLNDVVIGINFHWERKENQQFKGDLKFIIENEMITAINRIGTEDYLTSVIASEMSAAASLELLKAHAVISRSWLLAQIEKNREIKKKQKTCSAFIETEDERIRWYDREDHDNYDVCADDHCQRYQGITRTFENTEIVSQAIHETYGQVLTYNENICDARFYKCCGGMTEEFQNCWEDVDYPYLARIRDDDSQHTVCKEPLTFSDLRDEAEARKWILSDPPAFCNTHDKNILNQVLNNYDRETDDFYRWKVVYNRNELSELIRKRSGIDFGEINDLIPVKRGVSGRIVKLKIAGTKRTVIIGKELEIRKYLSETHLYSSAFVVDKEEDKFIFHGAGWGHGAGLCQIGAAVMGEKGYQYDKILSHYYSGTMLQRMYEKQDSR